MWGGDLLITTSVQHPETHSMCVSGSPPKPTLSVFNDQQEVMKTEEVMEGSSVSLRCSTKIFCPSRPPSLTWSSSLNENITERQYQNQTELISDLNFTVSHHHHRVTFTCTATHQLQQKNTTQRSRMLRVQCKTGIIIYTDLSSITSAVNHKVITWMIFSSIRCS